MKLMQPIKRKTYLAIVGILVVLIFFCIALFLSGFFQKSESYENNEVKNMTLDELNETLSIELDRIKKEKTFIITNREVDEDQKNVTLYEIYMNDDQLAELQGKEIRGWTISVMPDTKYMDEIEATHAEIREMSKIPELQISGSSVTVNPDIKEIELWVCNRTPENQALKGKVIDGWTIRVYVCSPPPTEKV